MPTLINNLTSTAVMTCVIGKCKNHDFFNLQSCNKTYNPRKDVCSLLIMFLSPVTRAPTPRPCLAGPPAPSWWGTRSPPSLSPGWRPWHLLSTRQVNLQQVLVLPNLLYRSATRAWTTGRGERSTALTWDMKRSVVRCWNTLQIGAEHWKLIVNDH